MLAQLSFWRCCAMPGLVLALVALFAQAAQAGVIVEVSTTDVSAASLESSGIEQSSDTIPPSQPNLSRVDQPALYGNGGAESGGPQSGSSTSSSPHGSLSALAAAKCDSTRSGGGWRYVTELDEPRVLLDALDSVFHPPRCES